MRLLIDANLSPRSAELLTDAGYPSAHVADVELRDASDEDILDAAAKEGWVIVTADSDFPALMARRGAIAPSVIHLRGVAELVAEDQVALLVANLPAVVAELDAGAVVSLSPSRLAVRALPIV